MNNLLFRFIVEACKKVYENDKYLINHKVNERSIVFRFGHYLQNILNEKIEFKSYNIDVEYNRNFNDPKRIYAGDNGIYPDIIIHKRGSNNNNLLAIECKTWWNSDNSEDIEKIKELTNQSRKYKYKYGISMIFYKQKVCFVVIEDGEQKEIKKKQFNKQVKNNM